MSQYKFKSLLCPTEKVSAEQLETEKQLLAFERETAGLNRRNFLGAFMATAALGAMATRSAHAQSTTPSIVDVLNFALNLEYLEANFYLAVSTGAVLTGADAGTSPGTVTGAPAKLALDSATLAVAQALAADEVHHIEQIRSTITSLGGTPISQPNINLAAKGSITTQAQFLAAARQFTAVGGSAYAGSATLLVTNPTVLTAASQILGAEGQHAGVLAYLCVAQSITSGAVDANDVPPSATNYFTLNSTTTGANAYALAPARTPQQVLGIVYGVTTATSSVTPAAGTTMGGFFPNGFNGNVKST